jgi:hypothetical protein
MKGRVIRSRFGVEGVGVKGCRCFGFKDLGARAVRGEVID